MRALSRYSDVVLNLLVAVAISLVVNFSYLLLVLVEQSSETTSSGGPGHEQRVWERRDEGRLAVHADGYGYLVYAGGDSVYVPPQNLRWLGLEDGDRIRPTSVRRAARGASRVEGGADPQRRGVRLQPPLQPSVAVDRAAAAAALLPLHVVRAADDPHRFPPPLLDAPLHPQLLWSCVAAVVLYCVAPVTEWHSGRVVLNFMSGRMFDYMLLLKCSFALVVSLLYSRLYVLISQRQLVEVENERLKNENLTTRYNMLVGQINPHFFFNSLNSLAMLVREKHDQKALTYIDQLSYTFRYIIQNGQSTLITLGEELKFAEAYSYLFKIRYADKLYFDIEVDPDYLCWRLPALSLQPLIGNAVKHNTITRSNPLHVSIRVEDGRLVVSNPLRPKLEPEPSTGIGLENLRNRWQLITGRDIEIDDSDGTFTVRLPLEPPAAR